VRSGTDLPARIDRIDVATGRRTLLAEIGPTDRTGLFSFDPYTPEAFEEAAFRALAGFGNPAKWEALMRRGMACDFSWERSVSAYLGVYRRALAWSGVGR